MEDEQACPFCEFDSENGLAKEAIISDSEAVAYLEDGRYGYGKWLVVQLGDDMLPNEVDAAIEYCPVCGRKLG